jgi:hypothetical protein
VARPSRQRLSQARQQQLIAAQRQRAEQYGAQLQRQAELARQRSLALQTQKRINQFRVQQQYMQWQQQQRILARNAAAYNYNTDPYFYTAPTVQYFRAGSYYQVNQFAADQLNQAVSFGYDEGFRAGQADKGDGWHFDYLDSYAYQDASYGYRGQYVDRDEYKHYFREGMSRGYKDGYYGRNQYGQKTNGGVTILSAVLQQILDLEPLQ